MHLDLFHMTLQVLLPVRGLKTAKNMLKIADISFFCHFLPLTGSKTLHLVEEVLSFDLVGHMWKSVKNWLQEWVLKIYKWKWGRTRWIAYFENYLQKQLGDRYGECPIAFPTKFPARFSHKHFPQDFPHKIFPQEFPARFSCKNFLQTFPTRFSHKHFLQDFPTRISYKIFPQDFPELDADWLASHHPVPNAKFPPITAFLRLAFSPPSCPTRFSRKNFPQTFPTRISHKIFPQDFPTNISHKNFPQTFPTRFSHKNFLQDFPTRISCKIFLKTFPARFSRKHFPQDFSARFSQAGCWFVGSPSPYSKC